MTAPVVGAGSCPAGIALVSKAASSQSVVIKRVSSRRGLYGRASAVLRPCGQASEQFAEIDDQAGHRHRAGNPGLTTDGSVGPFSRVRLDDDGTLVGINAPVLGDAVAGVESCLSLAIDRAG